MYLEEHPYFVTHVVRRATRRMRRRGANGSSSHRRAATIHGAALPNSSGPGTRPNAGILPQGDDRTRLSERAQFAAQLDGELQVTCRADAAARRHVGDVARDLLRARSYCKLGFVRFRDYARERLGLSARTVQAAAWVANRLAALPLISAVFDRSELSWTKVRALCATASAADEHEWLPRAFELSVDQLSKLARSRRCHPPDPEPEDGLIEDEPAVRIRVACPARVRALWRHAVELASRVAGELLTPWQAAEAIAAEALSGRPSDASIGDRALYALVRLAKGERRNAAAQAASATGSHNAVAPDDVAESQDSVQHQREDVASCSDDTCDGVPKTSVSTDGGEIAVPADALPADPFALDAQLRFAVEAIHTSEPRIGRLLRVIIDQKFYRTLGCDSVDAYVRERLGISVRKAWALVKVEKSVWRATEFRRAYYEGELTWSRALTLLPVLDRTNAVAWIERAQAVTARRLADEVNYVLEQRDVFGVDVSLDPPLDAQLESAVARALRVGAGRVRRATTVPIAPGLNVQMDAPDASNAITNLDSVDRARREVCDVEVEFTGPASVVGLFRDALEAHGRPGEPRWLALERVLRHVIGFWESLPRHHDPIFARDGWRCTVPGCTGRRSLHDHHLVWRSHGGGNARGNRTAVCAGHHLHGVHRHTIRAWGEAPHAVHWELGVRPNAPPLVSYVGDRICAFDARDRAEAAPP
jgi:hypothetical protein